MKANNRIKLISKKILKMGFKEIITSIENLNDKQLVSILILIDSILDLKTPGKMAEENKRLNRRAATRRGVILSPDYKKIRIGGRLFIPNGTSLLKEKKMKKEVWKDVKNFEGVYKISSHGRIKLLGRKNFMKVNNCYRTYKERILASPKKGCYKQVLLVKGNSKVLKYIHRIVAETFIPNPKNKPAVNHIDGKKHNNNLTNLEWATYSEDRQHAYDNKLNIAPKGTKQWKSRLSDKEVLAIRNINFSLITQTRIAKIYGVNQDVISKIIRRKSWRHI